MPFFYLILILLLISFGLLDFASTSSGLPDDTPTVSSFDADTPNPVSGFDGMQ